MPRTTTVRVDEAGCLRVRLPARLRKEIPVGSTFESKVNGNSITLTPKRSKSGERLLKAMERIRHGSEENNVTPT